MGSLFEDLKEGLEEAIRIEKCKSKTTAMEDVKEVLFTTVNTSFEADQIIAILMSNDIPAYKKETGSGQWLNVFMGMNTINPVDIYIPEELVDKANEVLDEVFGEKE